MATVIEKLCHTRLKGVWRHHKQYPGTSWKNELEPLEPGLVCLECRCDHSQRKAQWHRHPLPVPVENIGQNLKRCIKQIPVSLGLIIKDFEGKKSTIWSVRFSQQQQLHKLPSSGTKQCQVTCFPKEDQLPFDSGSACVQMALQGHRMSRVMSRIKRIKLHQSVRYFKATKKQSKHATVATIAYWRRASGWDDHGWSLPRCRKPLTRTGGTQWHSGEERHTDSAQRCQSKLNLRRLSWFETVVQN